MRYVITRHAQALSNDKSEYAAFDEPLTELGREQAEALAVRLAGRTFDVLLHSGSVRTQQTSEVLLDTVLVEQVLVDPRVREGEVGEWVGGRASMRKEVARETGKPVWEVRPPGGESYLDIDERLQPLLSDIRAGVFGPSVLLVGHGRLNGLAIRALRGTPWTEYETRQMHHTGVTEIDVSLTETHLLCNDDVSHLAPRLVTR
jgi:broad specificity phosphatase PhoE